MAKLQVSKILEDRYGEWDQFLMSTQMPSPFLQTSWLKAYHKVKGESFEILACEDKNGDIVGGFAYTYRVKFGRYKIIVNLLGIDSYIAFVPRDTKLEGKKESHYFEVYKTVLDYLEKEFSHIELTLNCSSQDIRLFQWEGYKEEVRYTYLGQLEDPQTMLSSFNPDVRNKIKKAEKLDYQFTTVFSNDEVLVSYDLIKRSLTKNRQPHIMSQSQYVDFCNDLNDSGMIKIANIYLENKPVASRVIIFNQSIAIDFQAGGDETLFNTGLNQLLSYKLFCQLKEIGVSTFDFRGANTPAVAKYKSGFNFKATPYFILKKDQGHVFKILMKGKSLLTK